MSHFETPEPISVVISLMAGDVRVTASERTDTVVDVRPSDRSKAVDVKAAEQTRVEFAHGRLLVKAPKTWRQYSPFGSGGSIEVEIGLPSGSDVQGDAVFADFRADGQLGECSFATSAGHFWVDHTGPLRLNTSAGGVTVGQAHGHTEITGCGDVRIREIDGTGVIKNLNGDSWIGEITGDLRCNAANGDITVDRACATIAAKTANGHIRIGEVVRGTVVLATACGNLEVGIREGTAALLDAGSQYGHVRNTLKATDGPGSTEETIELRARTSYGDITIRRA